MTRELFVWLFNEKVGTLRLEKGRLSFTYTKEYLARSNVVSLSASLPLQNEPFDDLQTRPFFSGLLPEGRIQKISHCCIRERLPS